MSIVRVNNSQLPPPGAPRPFIAPDIHVHTLASGLRVIVAPRRTVPLIGVQVTLPIGAATDPANAAGISLHAATLLGYGSRRLASDAFSEALDSVGGTFSGGAGQDAFTVSFSAMRRLFPQTLKLAAEAIRTPGQRAVDLERMRVRILSDVRLSMSTANSIGRQVLSRVVYGAHPYGTPLAGTVESNPHITIEGISQLLAERLRPEGATIVVVGDCDSAEALEFIESAFGDWQSTAAPAAVADQRLVSAEMSTASRTVVVNLPDSGRSAVLVGRAGLARNDPDYLQATVLNALFSGYSGRLNREIRVKRGLSYGAGSSLSGRLHGGSLTASTLVDHGKVGETISVMHETFADIAATPPSDDELRTRKAMLRGSFGRGLETVGGLAGAIGNRVVYGLPLDELRTYLDRLEGVTAAEILAVAARIAQHPAHTIIVGDAAQIAPQLAAGSFERFEATELDLRNPKLGRE